MSGAGLFSARMLQSRRLPSLLALASLLGLTGCSVRTVAVNGLGRGARRRGRYLRLRRRPRARRGGRPIRPEDDRSASRRDAEARRPPAGGDQRLHPVRVRLRPGGSRLRRGEGPRPGHRTSRPCPEALLARSGLRPPGARSTAPRLRERAPRRRPSREDARRRDESRRPSPLLDRCGLGRRDLSLQGERRPDGRPGARRSSRTEGSRPRRGVRAGVDPRLLHRLRGWASGGRWRLGGTRPRAPRARHRPLRRKARGAVRLLRRNRLGRDAEPRRLRGAARKGPWPSTPMPLPELRLANTVSQRRAAWLLARADELFLE